MKSILIQEKKKHKQIQGKKKSTSGSVTIEAAAQIPMFLFAVLCLIWIMEMQSIKISVSNAASGAAKKAVESSAAVPVLNTVKLKSDIVSMIGEERIDRSIIDGGTSGISCWQSYMIPGTGEIHITVICRIRLPLPLFGPPSAEMKESFLIHAWTGYSGGEASQDDGIVYITDNQAVYHEDYRCSYLQLSIRYVSFEELEAIRNESGGRYYPCDKCVYGPSMAGVYVSRTGSKYHNSLTCSGLKRTIHAVRKSEVSGLGGCSRCCR